MSTVSKLLNQARTIIKSITSNKKLVFYGLLLLALHIAGIFIFYELLPEIDIINHFWFGYVLSEYSSKGANSISLQMRLTEKFRKHGWVTAGFKQVDFLVRLAGFLLIGGLFWEWLELFSSLLLGIVPESFFAFPVTLRNIDGAIDVTVGVIGATLAFLFRKHQK